MPIRVHKNNKWGLISYQFKWVLFHFIWSHPCNIRSRTLDDKQKLWASHIGHILQNAPIFHHHSPKINSRMGYSYDNKNCSNILHFTDLNQHFNEITSYDLLNKVDTKVFSLSHNDQDCEWIPMTLRNEMLSHPERQWQGTKLMYKWPVHGNLKFDRTDSNWDIYSGAKYTVKALALYLTCEA